MRDRVADQAEAPAVGMAVLGGRAPQVGVRGVWLIRRKPQPLAWQFLGSRPADQTAEAVGNDIFALRRAGMGRIHLRGAMCRCHPDQRATTAASDAGSRGRASELEMRISVCIPPGAGNLATASGRQEGWKTRRPSKARQPCEDAWCDEAGSARRKPQPMAWRSSGSRPAGWPGNGRQQR